MDARNRLAVAYKAKGDAPSALAQIAKVLARDPKDALAHYTRADIYADHNHDDLALADAEKVVELQPENALGRALLGKDPGPSSGEARARRNKSALRESGSGAGAARAARAAYGAASPEWSRAGFRDSIPVVAGVSLRRAGRQGATTSAEFEKSSQNDRTTTENQTAGEAPGAAGGRIGNEK